MKKIITRIILLCTCFIHNLAIAKSHHSDFTCICGKSFTSNVSFYCINASRTNIKEIYIAGPTRVNTSSISSKMFCSEICAMNYYKTYYSSRYNLAEKPSDFEEILGTLHDFFKLTGSSNEPKNEQKKSKTTEVQQNKSTQPTSNSFTTIVKEEPRSASTPQRASSTITRTIKSGPDIAYDFSYGYFDESVKKFIGPKSKSEMDQLISNGIINGDTWISSRPINGGKWQPYNKATNYKCFDFGLEFPLDPQLIINNSSTNISNVSNNTDNKTQLIITEKTEAQISVSSTDNSFGVGGTIQRPDDKIDPLADNDGTHSFSVVGFNNWYVSVYGQNPSVKPILDQKTKSATLTLGDRKLNFTYNQVLSDWNLPKSNN